jgi:hypothetical protein
MTFISNVAVSTNFYQVPLSVESYGHFSQMLSLSYSVGRDELLRLDGY